MYEGYRIGAILLMAGLGNRMGSEIPKQFLILGKKRVYLHTLQELQKSNIFDEIVLVTHPDWLRLVSEEASHVHIVEGASTRQESSFIGLKSFSQKPDIVLIHDAVRPFVSENILVNNVKAAIQYGAVDTCIASADTLVYAPDGFQIEEIPQRSHFQRGQTPQTFLYEWLVEAHQTTSSKNVTDDCALVKEMGKSIVIVQGEDRNFKITTKFDINLAEFLLNNN